MDILPPRSKKQLNRQEYRTIGAEIRRSNKRVQQAPMPIGTGILDRPIPQSRNYGAKGRPLLQAITRVVGADETEKLIAGSPTESPLVRRVNNLTGIVAQFVFSASKTVAPEKALGDITTPQFAAKVMEAYNGLRRRGQNAFDALTGALVLCFLEGAAAYETGKASVLTDGYTNAVAYVAAAEERFAERRAQGGLAGLLPGMRVAPVARVNLPVDLTAATGGLSYAPPKFNLPPGLTYPRELKDFKFTKRDCRGIDDRPLNIFVRNKDDRLGIANYINNPPSWAGNEWFPNYEYRMAAWLYAVSGVASRVGATCGGDYRMSFVEQVAASMMDASDPAKFKKQLEQVIVNGVNIDAFLAKADSMGQLGTAVRKYFEDYGADDVQSIIVTDAATTYWKQFWFDPAKRAGLMCDEALRTDAAWIFNTQCKFDSQQCRDDKIKYVRNAFRDASGREPTACDINFYTQIGDDARNGVPWRDFIIAREAAGRPEVTQAEKDASGPLDTFGWMIDMLMDGLIGFGRAQADFLCKIFTAILPSGLASVLCGLANVIFVGGLSVAAMILDVVRELVLLLTDIIGVISDPKITGWNNLLAIGGAIFLRLNNIIISFLGVPFCALAGIPVTKTEEQRLRSEAQARGENPDETVPISLNSLKERLNVVDSFFAIGFIMGAVSLYLAVVATAATAGAAAIAIAKATADLIAASALAIGVIMAPSLMAKYTDLLRGIARDMIERGVAAIVNALSAVIKLTISLYEMFASFETRYKEYVKSNPNAKGAKPWSELKGGLWNSCKKMWNTVRSLSSTIRGKPAGNFKELGVEIAIVAGLMILLIVAMAYFPDPMLVNEIGDLLVEGVGAGTQVGIATTKGIADDLHSKFIDACVRCRDENIDCPACRGAALPALPEETPPDSTPPDSTPPPVKPPKKTGLNLGPALALAAGGALVGGPIGAAGGFIIGFVGALPKKKAS